MRAAVLTAAFVFVLAVGHVAAADEPAFASPPDVLSLEKTPEQTHPTFNDLMTMDIFTPRRVWSAKGARWMVGDNEFTAVGVLSTAPQSAVWGDPLGQDGYMAQFTWRYHGLARGMIRPVARFTAAAYEDNVPLGGAGFHGYATTGSVLLMPEAGVEFVYRGFGLGVTGSYYYLTEFDPLDPAADITGPGMPKKTLRRRRLDREHLPDHRVRGFFWLLAIGFFDFGFRRLISTSQNSAFPNNHKRTTNNRQPIFVARGG
ncbi:MAG: hypothetical protein M5R36_09970 [Deltaproteobacteria bacterium]|nr:hypothetical protein [Deltaproteobacteria bacterium]